jgi:hypothetical protein
VDNTIESHLSLPKYKAKLYKDKCTSLLRWSATDTFITLTADEISFCGKTKEIGKTNKKWKMRFL